MGYEDPAEVAERVAQASSKLAALIQRNSSRLPGELQNAVSVGLNREAHYIDNMRFWLVGYLRAVENVDRSGRPDLPKTEMLEGWYAVGDMPVWQVSSRRHSPEELNFADYRPSPEEAEIVIYLDKYGERHLRQVQAAAVRLADELGYTDFALTDEEFGSIFRRLRGKLRTGVKSDFVQQKMRELDMRASLEISGRARAEIDAITTSSAVNLIASLAEIPNAVVRVGGLLVVKQTVSGVPAVITRELSTREIRAFELNPGIQKDPQGVLQLLAAAVAQLEEDERDRT